MKENNILKIEEGTKVIKKFEFLDMDFKEIIIPDSVVEIGYGAFAGCRNLEKITIPDSVIKMGKELFWGCENLKEITFPKSTTMIFDFTFTGCRNLEKVFIPKNTKRIMYNAFENCPKLKTIYYEGTKENWNEIYGTLGKKKIKDCKNFKIPKDTLIVFLK